jgi:predicted anti-sigma-YlaC factor YlaD
VPATGTPERPFSALPGTNSPPSADYHPVSCAQYREAASAKLDGEASAIPDEDLTTHLTGCVACAAWYATAHRITRMARVGPADPVPDLVDAILASTGPIRRRPRRRELPLRIGIALAALTQAVMWWPDLLGRDPMTQSMHVSHESGVWNLALAVAVGWVAARPHYARGLLPMLAAVVVGLVGYSSADLLSGAVGYSRIVEHVPAASALLLIAGLLWVRRDDPTLGHGGRLRRPVPEMPAGASHDGHVSAA